MLTKLTHRARRALAACALALTALAAPASAEPALWAIKDHDSTIYILGSIHILRPGTEWRSPKIDKAFAASQDLVLEVVGADDAAAMQAILPKYGIDLTTRLSTRLDAADRERLAAAVAATGTPPQAVEVMRPWLASMSLSTLPLVKAGFDPKAGVELTLTAQAKAAGKPISGLETLEQQIRFLADLPPPVELAMLKATLEDFDKSVPMTEQMLAAWLAADQERLAAVFLAEGGLDDPAVYEAMLARRNRDWAGQLKAKLAGSGTSFVTVGAGHLVGADSLQAELAKLGVIAERQ